MPHREEETMASNHGDCPHCGAKNSVPKAFNRRLVLPLVWTAAFATIFGFALTTVILLMIAPMLFVITFCLIGGVHAWIDEADTCTACGKLVLSEAELRRMGPVRVIQGSTGAEIEVPLEPREHTARAA